MVALLVPTTHHVDGVDGGGDSDGGDNYGSVVGSKGVGDGSNSDGLLTLASHTVVFLP